MYCLHNKQYTHYYYSRKLSETLGKHGTLVVPSSTKSDYTHRGKYSKICPTLVT